MAKPINPTIEKLLHDIVSDFVKIENDPNENDRHYVPSNPQNTADIVTAFATYLLENCR